MFFNKKKELPITPGLTALKKIKILRGGKVEFDSIIKLNNVVRNYLKEKFKLPLTLTGEELIANINKRKIRRDTKLDLAHMIAQVYRRVHMNKNPITSKEFDEISKVVFKTIKEVATGQKIETLKVEKKIPERVEETPKILKKIEDALNTLGKDFYVDWSSREIRILYERIKKNYGKLKDKEKIAIYPKIMKVFDLKDIKKTN